MRIIFVVVLVVMFSRVEAATDSFMDSIKINHIDKNGLRQGYWIISNKITQKKVSEGYYIDDKKNGVWKFYDTNGVFNATYTLIDGVEDGPYKTYRPNGKIYGEGNYKNGKIHGEFIGYDTVGKVACMLLWENGELIKEQILVPNAKPNGTIEIIDGKKYMWNFGELKEIKVLLEK